MLKPLSGFSWQGKLLFRIPHVFQPLLDYLFMPQNSTLQEKLLHLNKVCCLYLLSLLLLHLEKKECYIIQQSEAKALIVAHPEVYKNILFCDPRVISLVNETQPPATSFLTLDSLKETRCGNYLQRIFLLEYGSRSSFIVIRVIRKLACLVPEKKNSSNEIK